MPNLSQFPIGASITLTMLEGDVHPLLHRLRDSEPVSWLPALDAWLITRRDDAIAVMRDAKTYTVDHPGFSTAQVVGPSMLSLDGRAHQQHRTPFERPFRKREVLTRFSSTVTEQAMLLLDRLIAQGRGELRREYAGPIAVQTMIAALGMERASTSAILGWYDTIVDAVTQVSAGEPVPSNGRIAFAALRENLLASLKRDPDSSLLATVGSMAQGAIEESLSDDQIVSNAAVLLFGGIETTEGMIANAFYHLLTNPDLHQQACANPDILPAVVEESLRLEPAASVIDRYATSDVQLGAAQIRAGDLVRISLAGANRDPETFPKPDHFDPHRPNLQTHVTFAQGPHVCLGIHLARLEAQDALTLALQRLPGLHLEGTQVAISSAKPQGLIFRKPQALHVRWDERHLTG